MKNKDMLNANQLEIAQRISDAAKSGDTESFENGIQEMFASIHDDIVAQATAMKDTADAAILAQRGVRQLTTEETEFYNSLIDAMKTTGDIKNALTNTDKTFPQTIIVQVMEDMQQDHPLIAAVDSVTVTGATKLLLNTDAGENAAWGALEAAITEEIDSGFKSIDLSQFKLSAWMPISIDMLELGANWIDSYIRKCLSEALAIGYENAIITGTGKDMPIGMDRSVADDVTVVGGVYPQKEAIAVTSFDRTTYGGLVARLAKTQYNTMRRSPLAEKQPP